MEAQLQYRQKLEQQIGPCARSLPPFPAHTLIARILPFSAGKLVQNFGGMIKASQVRTQRVLFA